MIRGRVQQGVVPAGRSGRLARRDRSQRASPQKQGESAEPGARPSRPWDAPYCDWRARLRTCLQTLRATWTTTCTDTANDDHAVCRHVVFRRLPQQPRRSSHAWAVEYMTPLDGSDTHIRMGARGAAASFLAERLEAGGCLGPSCGLGTRSPVSRSPDQTAFRSWTPCKCTCVGRTRDGRSRTAHPFA